MNPFADLTVEEYLLLPEDDRGPIDLVLEHVEPKKELSRKFKGKYYKLMPSVNSLFDAKLQVVLSLKGMIADAVNLETVRKCLSMVYDIPYMAQFYNSSIFDVFACYAWLVSELNEIHKAEKLKIHKKPTKKQKDAGIEMFEQLDNVPMIDSLAGGDFMLWEQILEQPYGKVMRKLLLNKLTAEYNEAYSKLK